jgi:RIO kinase 1
MKKGVAKQGHGRAENMNAAKTRGGAMDGNVRLQISAAINQGLIERCNGVVKEGKEALVYHAEGVQDPPTELSSHPDFVRNDGYDVAVKVFKRISEFKGRGMYVDGDPRFHKQKFKSNDQREQIVVWTEKEYRNLIRAHRGGVKVPVPLRQKENVLFMRFLGENGWPSPQLREIEIKKGSERWTVLYCQTIAAIRR